MTTEFYDPEINYEDDLETCNICGETFDTIYYDECPFCNDDFDWEDDDDY